ncbi:MAG TPA: MAPEG family protein [Bauldia sp.]|nr:MAPEG family protein [Bauldia sp.]
MSAAALLAPVFVQIALTFVLLLRMGTLRIRALRARQLRIRDIALGEPNWPQAATQAQNAYQNQLELPVLFYALVALVLTTGHATTPLVVLAWLFVLSRIAHAAIHSTSNNVPQRFAVYCIGLADLMLMWVLFALSAIAG